ncbi:hypothetical protein CBM2615_A20008 [Cupriavidus taiwanensis]|uniref:Uncharacterized protein n=1 Tax=Cupriavidus taiwanensis TaxID=164546 RepID=A0A976AU97_9BURK|nr:hypothetical protein CBM2615_A20008 [Cupriavidus taiwanensis]SOZ54964.1 hypothetical protein CBM2613_A20008 [Cupriavidus taiwanensis]SPA05339.1 hypothetical protein CBM2625_A20008 [Cupriavidus taiwanensis]
MLEQVPERIPHEAIALYHQLLPVAVNSGTSKNGL